MNPEDKKHLQEVTGKFLYYSRAVDDTMQHSLNCLSTQVNNGTKRTKAALKHFLDYCYDNPNAVKLYVASDMILFIDSDAAYLVETEAKSRAGGFFYLGNKDGKLMNGSILILAKIIKFVMSSAAEAEIAALFMNWDNGKNNFADYFTKDHSPSHHKAVRPIYLFDQNNELDMRGCIKILNNRGTPASKSNPCYTPVSNDNYVTNTVRASQAIQKLLLSLT